MKKRESSLTCKPLNSMGITTTTTLESNLSNQSKETFTIEKLPDWLVDSQQNGDTNHSKHDEHLHPFSRFTGNKEKVTSHHENDKQLRHNGVYRVRPLTENSGLGRPLWFQELIQSRRHSEVLLPSSFEEEDMSFRLSSIEMDQENSGHSSSDNVDIIMILDDADEMINSPSNCENELVQSKEIDCKISATFSSSSPSSRRSSLQLTPKESRKNRSLSQFFDYNDFKLSSKENQMFNCNRNNNNNRSLLLLNAEQLNNKCNENLLLTALDGLDSVVTDNYIDTNHDHDHQDVDKIFRRKHLGHRDSHTAADIDLVSLDEPEIEADFIIPELPQGQQLTIDIKSNWGDEDYVGFNGIEIFDLKTKTQAIIEKITCDSSNCGRKDENKLIDGVYRTHDDQHIWMTEYSPFTITRLTIKFQEKISIVLIRFWNYNKSRIYSYRGIRFVTMSLDGVVIFRGEIAKAIGELVGSPERFGDTILFTTDEMVLEDVANNDTSFQELLNQNV